MPKSTALEQHYEILIPPQFFQALFENAYRPLFRHVSRHKKLIFPQHLRKAEQRPSGEMASLRM